jgi:hypothetical protein
MTTTESTQEDEELQEISGRIERLEDAVLAVLDAAHIHGDGEAVCALINCLNAVVSSVECADCRNDLIEAARGHFNEIMAEIEQRPASDETPPSGHVH